MSGQGGISIGVLGGEAADGKVLGTGSNKTQGAPCLEDVHGVNGTRTQDGCDFAGAELEDVTPTTHVQTPREGASTVGGDGSPLLGSAESDILEDSLQPLGLACPTRTTTTAAEAAAAGSTAGQIGALKVQDDTGYAAVPSLVCALVLAKRAKVGVAVLVDAYSPETAGDYMVYVSSKALDCLYFVSASLGDAVSRACEWNDDQGLWIQSATLAYLLREQVKATEETVALVEESSTLPLGASGGEPVIQIGGPGRDVRVRPAYSYSLPLHVLTGVKSLHIKSPEVTLAVCVDARARVASCTVACYGEWAHDGEPFALCSTALERLELHQKQNNLQTDQICNIRQALLAIKPMIWKRCVQPNKSAEPDFQNRTVLAYTPNFDNNPDVPDFLEQVCTESWQLASCLYDVGRHYESAVARFSYITKSETWRRMVQWNEHCTEDSLSQYFVPLRTPNDSACSKELLEYAPLETEYL